METGLAIRKARAEDVGAILAIETGSFDRDGFSRVQFRYLVTRSKGAFYVAETDGAIAGYICLLAHPGRANLRIYSIAILPRYRGRGIAGALIEKAKQFAVREKKSSLSLEVRTDNMPAIKLYEKHGFRVTFVKKRYYEDLTDAFHMRLPLG